MIADQSYFQKLSQPKPKFVFQTLIDEILMSVKVRLSIPPKKWKVLDVGSGYGEYSFVLSKYVGHVVGLEPYKPAYLGAIKNKQKLHSPVIFKNVLVEDFVTTAKFNLVLSITSLEHMPNAQKSFEKIFSLLSPQGIIYLTAPNKWWPYEYHYRLPFLSWLPLPLADLYLKITGKGDSYADCAYAKSYFGLKSFLNQFPCTYDFIIPEADAPYLSCGKKQLIPQFIKHLGILLIRLHPIFWCFSKGFIVIIQKTI